MLQDGFFDSTKPTRVFWRDLPHWRQDGACYFVTTRLADSLPASVLSQWRRERDRWREEHPDPTARESADYERLYRRRLELWLDRGSGSCALRAPEIAGIVEDSLRCFDGQRYELGETTIAGNHVHATIRTFEGFDLSRILESWKKFTSRAVHRLPGFAARFPALREHFWQVESFDHIVRSEADLDRFHRYIRNHAR